MSKTWRPIKRGKEGFVRGKYYRERLITGDYDMYRALTDAAPRTLGSLYWQAVAGTIDLYPVLSFEVYVGKGAAPKGWTIDEKEAGNV